MTIEEAVGVIYEKGKLNGSESVRYKSLVIVEGGLRKATKIMEHMEADGDISGYQGAREIKEIIEDIRKEIKEL